MTKERVQRLVVGPVVVLFVASALAYLLVPAGMLSIVGIQSNPQTNFWSAPLPPHCWHCPPVPGLHGAVTTHRLSAAS